MWGLPLFDIKDPAAVLFEVNMCKKAKPNYYVKLACFDNTRGTESCVIGKAKEEKKREEENKKRKKNGKNKTEKRG